MNLGYASDYSDYLEVMENAPKCAGEKLLQYWGDRNNLEVSTKNPHDFVTEADKSCEEIIKTMLKEKYPSYAILAEESGYEENEEASNIFIIDPLDGTTNFIKGRRDFCISIGLAKKVDHKLKSVAGVIYAPLHHELFKAAQGKGAYLNDIRIQVSNESELDKALITVEVNEEINTQSKRCQRINNFMPYIDILRARTGSAALDLAHLACGRHDGFISYGLCSWDVAAGIILIQEAGGKTSDFDKKELVFKVNNSSENYHYVNLISSNHNLYDQILSKIT